MTSQSKFAALIAGVGSGKSWVGTNWIIQRVIKYPKALHFIGANTYAQLRDATLETMFRNLESIGLEYTFNQVAGLLQFAGGRVLCKSLDNYDALRGIEIGSFLLDESRDTKQEAFDMMMGRLRDKNVAELQGRITTSPSGFNWIYDYFHPDGEKNTKDFEMITASSMENTFLPDGYIDSIKSMYSDEFYQQEIMGQFVRGGQGIVYPWIITAKKHKLEDIKPIDLHRWTMVVTLDPAATSTFGVLFLLHNYYTKKSIIVDEIYQTVPALMTSREMWKQIDEKLEPWKAYVKDVEYVIDSASAYFISETNEIKPNVWLNPSRKHEVGVDGYINIVRSVMHQGLIEATDNCVKFWKEHEGYSKDDKGKIPKINDHLVNCLHYCVQYLGFDLSFLNYPKDKPIEDMQRYFKPQDDLTNGNSLAEI